jgi:hypothetical protein
MGKKAVMGAAVLLAVLLGAIVFVFGRQPPSPAITVRHVQSVQSGSVTTMTFEITNHSTKGYLVYLWCVEANGGPVWRTCFDLRPQPALPLYGLAHSQISTLKTTNVPTGLPLRLRMGASKECVGLETLFPRLGFRLRGGQISLNPFDKTKVFGVPTPIVSDEFVEPSKNSTPPSD